MTLLKPAQFLRGILVNNVFIIAEAGVNHNGSLELAKKLIDVAVEAGVDAVKFQTFKADKLVCKSAQKAVYQKQATDGEESQYQMIKKLELDEAAHRELIAYCKQKQVMFLSTAFDHDSVNMLNDFGMPIFKISSGEITNLPYLRHIGRLRKDIVLSTGMADLGEIEDALDVLIQAGVSKESITVLHATTEYPCPIEEVNLRAMQTIQTAFGVKVGYSDHTQGIAVPLAAVAMGACVIEKHFTLNRTMEGPDHKASLEPEELKAMVVGIRNISQALGNGIKKPSKSEMKNMQVARKSIVASRIIKAGEVFCEGNITIKRPGYGISPMRWDEIIGKVAQRDYESDDLI
jgi:N,N'-diacetyllegionaminate synthase